MKLKNMFYVFAITVLVASQLYAQNTNPVVSEVSFSISGKLVTVLYKVADAEQTTVTISMEVSSDGGSTWGFNYGTANGLGTISGVSSVASQKTITWTYDGVSNTNFMIRIFANDEIADGSPCAGTPTVDYSGFTYHTIQIGTQCWLKENLDVGSRINGNLDQTNNSTIEKYCYNDDVNNCTTYGGLYQWNEAMAYAASGSNVQGICPTGWHIPTYTELLTLISAVSSNGNALKAIGQGTVSFSDEGTLVSGEGTNTSGFSLLLAGSRNSSTRLFNGLGLSPNYWSSTEGIGGYPWFMYPINDDSSINFGYGNKGNGFSVRCAKD